jgi:hypothetical protein
MGLLRKVGVPIGGKGDFHPAPAELRSRVADAASFVEDTGEKLETVSIRWALEQWATVGAAVGSKGQIGVSVLGVSKVEELEETMRVWSSIVDGFESGEALRERNVSEESRRWSLARRREVQGKVERVWELLGEWKDYAWPSPGVDYVNVRAVKGVVDEVQREVVGSVQESVVKDSRL